MTCLCFGTLSLSACEVPDEAGEAIDATTAATTAATTGASTTAASTGASTTDAEPEVELADPGPCPDGPDSDGCRARSTVVTQLAIGADFTCARHLGGAVRCWGDGGAGHLGTGNVQSLGDQPGELPVAAINLGGNAEEVRAGMQHTCARLDTGKVRCWGYNNFGQLGYGHTQSIGDGPGEMPPLDVNVGAPVKQITTGAWHTCALLQDGHVRCWGYNWSGELGVGHRNTIGDGPGEMPPANVAGLTNIVQIVASHSATCAIGQYGTVSCWGSNGWGELGAGHTSSIGDDPGEVPSTVNLGFVVTVKQLTAGMSHFCALSNASAILCWGYNGYGQLGVGHTSAIGNNPGEMPPASVSVGGTPTELSSSDQSVCALLTNGKVRCWGGSQFGELGYANTNSIGDNPGEMPPPDVSLGSSSTKFLAGGPNAQDRCAVDTAYNLRCWGRNGHGQLGYGHTNMVGDNEHPVSAGPVPY